MIPGTHHNRRGRQSGNRSAFTLIEMMVVITIMLIVFSMTAGVVSLAINTDRIPSSSRTVQAALLGARDRAVRAGKADLNQQPYRGVRFVLDPKYKYNADTTSSAITSLVYVGNQDDWTTGQISIDNANPPTFTRPASWPASFTNSYLNDARIKIKEGAGTWHRLYDNSGTLQLSRPYTGTTGTPFMCLIPESTNH